MQILSNSGKKAVNISKNQGGFIAAYVEIDALNERERLIEMVTRKTEAAAIKWAKKQLN